VRRALTIASVRREHLVETAFDLFYKHGFHATGIDTILARCGVAKMTLYKHFKSKEELILATLELRHERWSTWFQGEIERRSVTPRERLLLAFEVLGEWFRSVDFRGCFFLNAASEYSGLAPCIAEVVASHKRWVRELLEGYAAAAQATDAAGLGRQLALLVEGAIAVALVERTDDAAQSSRDAAAVLVRAALPEAESSPSSGTSSSN